MLTVTTPVLRTVAQCREAHPELVADFLFDLGKGMTIGALIDGRSILRLLDRCFGGAGGSKDPAQTEFSLSAQVMIDRVATILAAVLGRTLELDPPPRPHSRNEEFRSVQPFTPDLDVFEVAFGIIETNQPDWQISFMLPRDQVERMLDPHSNANRHGLGGGRLDHPVTSPCNDLPLTLQAVLVDITISLSRVANLQPGDIIPVTIADDVQLRIGNVALMRGAAGSIDDRLAIQIDRPAHHSSPAEELS